MFDGAQLAGFVMAVVVLVLVPGPNTMLIMAHSLGAGRRAGLATVLGVETATLVHTGAAALGLSAVLATSALAFELLKYMGAAYLMLLGLRTLLGGGHPLLASTGARLRLPQAYARPSSTCSTRKWPCSSWPCCQFVNPERGPRCPVPRPQLIVSAVVRRRSLNHGRNADQRLARRGHGGHVARTAHRQRLAGAWSAWRSRPEIETGSMRMALLQTTPHALLLGDHPRLLRRGTSPRARRKLPSECR
jgi:hypothetical protein